MPLIGIEHGKADLDTLASVLDKMGLTPMEYMELEIKTKKGWIKFIVADVLGFTDGVASKLSTRFNCIAFESGSHLRFGEPSAGIWEDAVKVVFPDGDSEIIRIILNDNFLNLKLASEYVKGLKSYFYVKGVTFELPLSRESLHQIYLMGGEAIDKLHRAVSAYGYLRILSEDALKPETKKDETSKEKEESKKSEDHKT
ncbi:MAG: hypothetical protein ACP5IZ_01845 [Thermoprotei archaeon]|jgi:hypothetical protein